MIFYSSISPISPYFLTSMAGKIYRWSGLTPTYIHLCVGKIRYIGVVLYDLDKVYEAATAPEDKFVEAFREAILDPYDEEVITAAKKSGIPDS